MIRILLLLQLDVLLILLLDQLLLLFLVLLVEFGVTAVGSRRLVRLQVAGVYRWGCPAAISRSVGRGMVRSSRFSGGNDAFSFELCRPAGCRDRRRAMIHRSAQLRVGARSLQMLNLRRHRGNMPFLVH